jgi:hypothetical protein
MLMAALAGSAPPFFSLIYVWFFIDRTIRGYYPRLLALELMLGFHFWRETLKALKEKEQAYVEECERVGKGASSASDLWQRVRAVPRPRFSPFKRGHKQPAVAAGLLAVLYLGIVFYLWPGNPVWQQMRKLVCS